MNSFPFDQPIQNVSELEFAIFCIENLAKIQDADVAQVYDALVQSDILNGYIIPEYEVLHTQGKDYIMEDLLEVMKERGVAI
ncbi:MAG: DUF3791 domain-containing protein [Lachnospiraceae bacterium]|nr:DUF3791 domain-containing protein [Lachnospiraceae bacterium]